MKHLSLETCQRLKAAKYPQDGSMFVFIPLSEGRWRHLYFMQAAINCPKGIACPTADELLEALGGEIDWLEVDATEPGRVCYQARYDGEVTDYADTPAEALAALWLTLNEQAEGKSDADV